MTQETDTAAPWQIEIDRGDGKPADYYSFKAMKLTGQSMTLVLPDGEQVVLKGRKIRKLLVMKTKVAKA